MVVLYPRSPLHDQAVLGGIKVGSSFGIFGTFGGFDSYSLRMLGHRCVFYVGIFFPNA